jgi:hypothetical protein
MYARKISLKIASVAIVAIGLLVTVSTLDLIKNNIPTTFAQPTPSATNNTQGTVSTSPFSSCYAHELYHAQFSNSTNDEKSDDGYAWYKQEYDCKSFKTSTKYGNMFSLDVSRDNTEFKGKYAAIPLNLSENEE